MPTRPGGIPASYFEPGIDTPERFLEAEWDFFLSDNAARTGPYKAAGSGLLIWHIDEGVIRDVWDAERNLFNGDPDHKSVDLEEADGIQDLDRRQGTAYWLGADVDTWKQEGNHAFGPETRPATGTNGGVPTGLVIDQISAVVADSVHVYNPGSDGEYTGILFQDTMSFRCGHATGAGQPPVMAARDLPGVDLGANHLRAARLTVGAAGHTVVATANDGRVYAFLADLTEAAGHDGDPTTDDPLCVGTNADGAPVSWIGSVAIGRFEAGTGDLTLVLTAPHGLYAFRADGTPVMTGAVPGSEVGLIAPLDQATLPAVLLPSGGADAPMVACVGTTAPQVDGAPTVLRFLDVDGAAVHDPVTLPGRATSAPVLADGLLLVPVIDDGAVGRLVSVSWPSAGQPTALWSVALDLVPGSRPLTVADARVLISDDDGRVQTVSLVSDPPRVNPLWSDDLRITSTVGTGGAVLAGGRFGRLGEGGAWQTGWPLAPLVPVTTAGAEPLALGDAADPAGYLFGARDGRLYLTDPAGGVLDGWPLAGPADLVGTPVVLDDDAADGLVGFVVAGVTPQVVSVDPDTDGLVTVAVTRLRAWTQDLPASLAPDDGVAQYGQSAAGRVGMAPLVSPAAAAAAGSLSDTHLC